jgi:leucyl/phenylalanyl-tRNA--protein transferase
MRRPIVLRSNDSSFPAAELALKEPNGLLAIGGDLAPARLLNAYGHGIFPWFSDDTGPILWWSPDPRAVIFPDAVNVSRSLRRTLSHGAFEVRLDTAFEAVVRGCAAPRDGDPRTWITPAIRAAYCELHRLGYAHSVETWADGELAGGLYGVSVGRMFFGESMFARRSDASKVALVHLAEQLNSWRFELIDCQVMNPHLRSLGAVEMARREFLARLRNNPQDVTRRGPWRFDER